MQPDRAAGPLVPATTPEWVKDAVFYQIFPDRFARSARLAKPNNLEPWDSPPTTYGYKGGDLVGVLEHLDHIQDLGATAIYFTPIFQSASNHRYHTHDYFQVDPLLGGNAAFTELLAEAKRRSLRVVLDGVFNHASRGFFYFNDILENGRASPYLDWFTVDDFPPNAYDHSRPAGYAAWWGLHALPKLNTANPLVRDYLMRVAEYWLQAGIDGWRLDVPMEIDTPGFWEQFRRRVKAINPEAYIVGEIWEPAVEWLQGDRFDGVMNYVLAGATLAYTAGPRVVRHHCEGRSYQPSPALSGVDYARRMQWLIGLYPWENQLAQLNLLDSHDAARAITLAGGDRASVYLATLLLLTFPGPPSIFYGDEIGLPGGLPDYDTRRTFPWERPERWDLETLAYHRRLIALRHAHPALRRGRYRPLYADDQVYVFERRLGGNRLVIAVNAATEPRTVRLPFESAAVPGWPPGARAGLIFGSATVQPAEGGVDLSFPAREGAIWLMVGEEPAVGSG